MSKGTKNDLAVYFEDIIRLISQGITELDQIQAKTDLDKSFISRALASREFEETFKTLDPDGFEAWKEDREKKITRSRVKSRMRANVDRLYETFENLVLRGEMQDFQRASLIRDILKADGVFGEDGGKEEDPLRLSPTQQKVFEETLREVALGNRR